MTNDMTIGNPTKLILSFSVPLLIGNIFQQLYNMVDTLIVGRTISVQALAAVGSTGSISFLVLGFVMGLTSGFSVITAQCFGANDIEGVRRSVTTSISLGIIATIVLTAISTSTAHLLLNIMNTPADIIDQAYSFIIVIYSGVGATVFYNLLASIIRALGDSKTPLKFLIASSVINVILDFVLILFFSMGVAGAACATVISQCISGVLCLIYILKKMPIIKLKKEDWKFDADLAYQHLKVGLPMAFQFSITAIGVMVIQTALNAFGSSAVAAFTAASKIEQITTQLFPALGTTMATFSAQNYGAGKIERIRFGVKKCVLISMVFSAATGLIVFIFGGNLVKLFVGENQPEVINLAVTYLNILAASFFILGLLFIFRNTLQGMGKSTAPLFAGVCEMLMRVFAAFFLSKAFGYVGVCLSSTTAWFGATSLLIICYYYIMTRLPSEL